MHITPTTGIIHLLRLIAFFAITANAKHTLSHSDFLAGIDNAFSAEPENSHKSISIPFEITDFNQIIVTVCLGTPRNCYPFKLATNMNECYILHKDLIHFGFDDKASSTFQSNDDSMWFEVQHQMLHGEIVSDTLTIPDTPIELERFVFYLVKQEEGLKTLRTKDYVGVLGLGKKYEDYAMSFMSQLYLTDHIDDQMFSLTYKPSTSKGFLTIGYHDYAKADDRKDVSKIMPTQLGNTNRKYRIVPIEETASPSFEVKMNAIIYTNDLIDNGTRAFSYTQTVLFSPGANHIYCPNKFYSLLLDVIFYDLINKGRSLCWSEQNGEYEVVKCKRDVLTAATLGDIRFVFRKWNVKISLMELFDECDEDYVCFSIVNIRSSDQWIMGYHFLKRYPVIFDADDYKIALKIK